MRQANLMIRACCAVVFALLLGGCTQSNDKAEQLSTLGKHPADWGTTHWAAYAQNQDQCRSCHGSTKNPSEAGGIAKVSCFTCHPKGIDHPDGWRVGSQHGRQGAQLAPALGTGFAECFKCHGTKDKAGLTTTGCQDCHKNAPHPDRPWNGATSATSNHTFTRIENAPQCIQCHAAGANSVLKPKTSAPAGTAPGCFNNTMCHGTSI